jgi:TRAP-type C4-dicarboxylate transport system substrate-binding protein
LWHYAIDPLILAVSGKTWTSLSVEDRNLVRKVGEEVMTVQKREAREGLERDMTLPTTLQQLYGMEVVQLSPADRQAFRQRTRNVYKKWASEIGAELVHRAERIVEDSGR